MSCSTVCFRGWATDVAEKLPWEKLMEQALTAPGSLTGVYDRFHNYSITNMMLFLMQGIFEPVASESRWKSLGRTKRIDARRKQVIVPLFAKEPDPEPVPEGETIEEKRERVSHLLTSARRTKAVVDWRHGSTTEGRLARRAAEARLGLETRGLAAKGHRRRVGRQ